MVVDLSGAAFLLNLISKVHDPFLPQMIFQPSLDVFGAVVVSLIGL